MAVAGEGKSLVEHFGKLEDPLIERSKRHSLMHIITIAICAVICGADSWVYMEISAGARRRGSVPFWICPTGYHPMTPLVRYSPG